MGSCCRIRKISSRFFSVLFAVCLLVLRCSFLVNASNYDFKYEVVRFPMTTSFNYDDVYIDSLAYTSSWTVYDNSSSHSTNLNFRFDFPDTEFVNGKYFVQFTHIGLNYYYDVVYNCLCSQSYIQIDAVIPGSYETGFYFTVNSVSGSVVLDRLLFSVYIFNQNNSSYNGGTYTPSYHPPVYYATSLKSVVDSFDSVSDALKGQTDTVTEGYDSSSGSSSNDRFSGSFGDLDVAEAGAIGNAKENFAAYDFGSVLNFSAGLLSGLSFVTTFINGFFFASGDLAVIVSAVYCMALLAVVVGLWRFFRGS